MAPGSSALVQARTPNPHLHPHPERVPLERACRSEHAEQVQGCA